MAAQSSFFFVGANVGPYVGGGEATSRGAKVGLKEGGGETISKGA